MNISDQDRDTYGALGRLRVRVEQEPDETLRDQCLRIFRELDAKQAARDALEYAPDLATQYAAQMAKIAPVNQHTGD